jgi:1-acyl-sn-glycerol-3-phosphate acyltransferase
VSGGVALTRGYRAVISASAPIVRLWGRLEVSGLEHLPAEGPVLLAGNHDSYWDPISVGVAALKHRQVHALAKDSLWKVKVVGLVLDSMAQIPVRRGKSDALAMERAITKLREGACIGIFPEGTRSRGRELRARSGIARLAQAVPEAEIVCCSIVGTTDISRFPKRPRVRIRFFRPAQGGLQPGESGPEFSARLLAEMRAEAPVDAAGWRRRVLSA